MRTETMKFTAIIALSTICEALNRGKPGAASPGEPCLSVGSVKS